MDRWNTAIRFIGTPPFGYCYLPERRILVPVPSDARVVREIFERYVERRSGSVAVSNWLNDSRRVTRRGSRWTPKTVLDVLRNATYTGKLPFNGDLYDAEHEPIIDEETFERAQKLLEQRAESLPSRAANASDYLLTGLLQCDRCGHGFIGTSAHGRGGVYRYYTCFSRQRHGTARCDQERIPADPLEEAIVAEALAALDDGSIFLEAARKADEARTAARSDEEAERRELSAEIASKREAIDRYLRAFETGELPPSACGDRLQELHKEIEALEKRSAALEAELAETTRAFSGRDLARLKREIGAALLGADPEQVKELLAVVVNEIRVEGRSSIQPFFVATGVRTPARRRIRLAASTAGLAVGSVDLDDFHAVVGQEPGEPSPIRPGPLDADLGYLAEALCPGRQRHVAARRGRERTRREDGSGGIDDRCDVDIGVSVDPHGHGLFGPCHAFHRCSFHAIGQDGTHLPGRRTALQWGTYGPGSYQVHFAQPVGAPSSLLPADRQVNFKALGR